MSLRVRSCLKLVSSLSLLTVCTLFGQAMPVAAALPAYDLTTSYDIQADKRVNVQQVFTSNTTSLDALFATMDMPVIGTGAKNATVRLLDNQTLEASINAQTNALHVDFTKATKKNRKWSFVVSYNTALESNYGKIEAIVFSPPAYAGIDIGKHTVSVGYDIALGLASISSPKPTSEKLVSGKEVATFESAKGAFAKPISLHFGDTTVARMTTAQNIYNASWWWQTYDLALPPDTGSQEVALESITPRPNGLRIDEDGNIIASYRLRPHQSIKVEADIFVKLKTPIYLLDGNAATVADLPDLVRQRYTKLGDGVLASDAPIIGAMKDLYDKSLTSGTVGNARAEALLTSLQQKGLAARLVQGYRIGTSTESAAWVEAYVPKVGWVMLDAAGDLDFAAAEPMRIAGRVGAGEYLLAMDTVKFEPKTDLPEMSDEASVVSTNRMILPGLALGTTQVTMSNGRVTDDNALEYPNGLVKLGSLAPLQSVVSRQLLLGGKAFSSQDVTYGVSLDDEEFEPITKTSSKVDYTYMIGLVGLIVISIVLKLVKRHRRSKRSQPFVLPETPTLSIPSSPPTTVTPAAPMPSSPAITAAPPRITPQPSTPVVTPSNRPRMPYRVPVSAQTPPRRPPTLIQ